MVTGRWVLRKLWPAPASRTSLRRISPSQPRLWAARYGSSAASISIGPQAREVSCRLSHPGASRPPRRGARRVQRGIGQARRPHVYGRARAPGPPRRSAIYSCSPPKCKGPQLARVPAGTRAAFGGKALPQVHPPNAARLPVGGLQMVWRRDDETRLVPVGKHRPVYLRLEVRTGRAPWPASPAGQAQDIHFRIHQETPGPLHRTVFLTTHPARQRDSPRPQRSAACPTWRRAMPGSGCCEAGVIERWAFLVPTRRPSTLLEGSTPLLRAPRLAAELAAAGRPVWLKYGHEPDRLLWDRA